MSPDEKRRRSTIACRKWAKAHPEKRREINKRARVKAREDGRTAAQARAKRVRNPEINRAATARWRAQNLDRSKALIKAWDQNNPEKRAEIDRRRRARKMNALGNVTAEEFSAIVDDQYGTCFYCGDWEVPMTMDHMLPLSRGGSHRASNIVACCKSCNSRKSTRTIEEYLAILGWGAD